MTISGNIGTLNAGGDRAHTDHHPVVMGNAAVLADNGEYPIGLIVKEDANGYLVPHNGSADTDPRVGVIDEPVDTAEASSALVVRHGTVRASLLKVGAAGTAAEAADIKQLATIGIYAV